MEVPNNYEGRGGGPLSETVSDQKWRTLTPEALALEWAGCLIADGIWKNPSAQQMEVLVLIARFHLRYERVQMSQAFIAEQTGTSRSTVQRVIRDLDRAGIQRRHLSRPEIDRETGQFISRRATHYTLCERAKRRGYRTADRRRVLRNACKRKASHLGVTSDARTSSLGVKTQFEAVGPVSEAPQQPLSRSEIGDLLASGRREGRLESHL